MKTSKAYIFFCVFGIFLIALVTILVTQRYDPTGRTNLGAVVGGICAVAYLGGIILYWFAKIFFQGAGSPDQETIGDATDTADFRHLKSWRTLFGAMADPADREAQRISRGLRWHVILSFALTSAMVLILTGGALLADWGSTGRLVTALWVVLPLWSAGQILIFRVARGRWDRLMKGLGLTLEGGPVGFASVIDTQVVYGGARKGRVVGVGIGGAGSVAWAETASPEFTASYDDAGAGSSFKFEGAAPLEVRRWCGNLPRLEVWKGLDITANAKGVSVQRPTIGTYLWLYDLWLAENLAERIAK